MKNAYAGGGPEFDQEQTIEPIQAHVQVKPKTDSFVKIVSDVHPGILAAIGVCLVIGAIVIGILVLKLTPVGKMVAKAWTGLGEMFNALIKWKPKGK